MTTIHTLTKYYNYKVVNNEVDFVNQHIKNFLNYPDKQPSKPFEFKYNLLVKLYIIFYMLKKQFKIVLGEMNKDFDIFLGNSENWNFKVCNDSFIFYDTPKIYIKIKNVIHFFTDCCIMGNPDFIDNDFSSLQTTLRSQEDWINLTSNDNNECFIQHIIKKANVKQVNEEIKSSNYYVRDLEFENIMNSVIYNNNYKHIYIGEKLSILNKYRFTDERKYTVEEIIEVCINAKKLLTKYKTYLSNVEMDNKLKTYRTLEKKLEFYNDVLYCVLKSVFNKVYNPTQYNNYQLKTFKSKYVILPELQINLPVQTYFMPNTLQQIKNVDKKELENLMNKNRLKDGFSQIYNPLKNDLEIYIELQNKLVSSKEDVDRGSIRINQTKELLSKMRNITYVDFGGSDGTISSALTSYMKIPKEKSFSVDIENWFNLSNIAKYNNITYIRVKENNPLEFKDNSVDFITCFQVLHHIKNFQFVISEFKRILKPGGIILLREHDCRNDGDRMLIDVEHSVNEITQRHLDRCNAEKYLNDYEAYYESRSYWLNAFRDFKLVSNQYTFTKDVRGPTRYYYEVFSKSS